MTETGHISIHTENILPIIKKWLYSEKEIFLRELVSNAADAITKLQKLQMMGEGGRDSGDAKITITIDKERGTLSITDTGLGMTADEIKKYINQVAFSGVKDFLDKFKDKGDEDQVIGHFGLGFYSSFMVADKVEIDSLSYQDGTEAAHWLCEGSTEFTLTPSERKDVGTTITLHVSEDSKEMLDEATVRSILNKYCAFIKFPIELAGNTVNDPRPIWTKAPSELKDEDYRAFYDKLFPFTAEPLFWIHLNLDYPFKLRGILYFPQLRHELDASQGEVKLYCNQVYVADNPKELVPDFLTLLKGVVDCPDLPLNVSRSYLQNDPTVRKIREHISKKVADRLSGMAKTERETYVKYWDDIHAFVKYGMMRDPKFYEKMQEHLIFKSSSDDHVNLDDYLEKNKDKTDGKIIYASDRTMQASYLALLKDNGVDAIIADSMIDQHFLPYVEMQSSRKYHFQRIDADVLKNLVESSASTIVDPKDNKTSAEKIEALFNKFLAKGKVKIRVETLKSAKIPAMLLFDENVRRMKEMAKLSAMMGGGFGGDDDELEHTLVVNAASDAVKSLVAAAGGLAPDEKRLEMIVQHIYDLAYMQHGKFTPDAMQAFIERSAAFLGATSASAAK